MPSIVAKDWQFKQISMSAWIAVSDNLGVTLQGDDCDHLHSLIKETQAVLYEDLITAGDLVYFLRERPEISIED